jgi:MoxR-like ATPase
MSETTRRIIPKERRLIPAHTSRGEAAQAESLPRDERKRVVEDYRNLLREAEAARAMVRKVQERRKEVKDSIRDGKEDIVIKKQLTLTDSELGRWLAIFARQKKQIDLLREKYGKKLDRAHREWIKEKMNFVNFKRLFHGLQNIERAIREYSPTTLDKTSVAMRERKRGVASQMERNQMTTAFETEDQTVESAASEMTDALKFIFDDEETETALREEIAKSVKSIEAEGDRELYTSEMTLPDKEAYERKTVDFSEVSLSELEQAREDLLVDCETAWAKPGVQYRWFESQFSQWTQANLRGDRVLEFPSVIKVMNELDDIERTYKRTTIGGVLVGEPGVGKTTMVEHFLGKKGRKPVCIDMSEEVSRYQLYGSPSIQTESSMDQHRKFADAIAGMNDNEIKKLVKEHAEKLGGAMSAFSQEEKEVVASAQLVEQVSEEGSGADIKASAALVRERLHEIVSKAYRSDVAKKLEDVTKKNGWRDGIVIHALRNNYPLIIDEFNKAKSWTLLHRLSETEPGTKFYFADNNEWIDVPEDWRMYFTGNIGQRHGTFGVREAFASRIGGKVIKVETPPPEEERTAMLTMICDSDARLMRPPSDVVNLLFFIKDVVPKVRNAIQDQSNVIPISYRLERDLAEQLVDYEKMMPRRATLDEALLRVLLRPYVVFEAGEIPKNIARLCVAAGLLLGKEVEKEVIKWTGFTEKELEEKRKDRAGIEIDPSAALSAMRDSDQQAMVSELPEATHI